MPRLILGIRGYVPALSKAKCGGNGKVYEEYKKAPEVTRTRMYLETMERVLGGTDRIILDSKDGQGVAPLIPLEQLQNKKR
jgi:modulator of FtsH protease HflK